MNTRLLLPNSFKKAGIILLVPCLILSLISILEIKLPAWLNTYFSNSSSNKDMLAVLLIISLFFTGFSREKTEDEAIMQVRLNSLLWSVYINYTTLLAAYMLLDITIFLTILVYSTFAVLLLYIIIFNLIIYRNSKKALYE